MSIHQFIISKQQMIKHQQGPRVVGINVCIPLMHALVLSRLGCKTGEKMFVQRQILCEVSIHREALTNSTVLTTKC